MRVVVTGANRGIGLEFVRQLLARGGSVHAAVRSLERARELKTLESQHLRVHQCDVSDEAAVQAFAAELKEPLDILINNAGILGDQGSFENVDPGDILEVFRSNAQGPMMLARRLLPNLRKGTAKKIINITSEMGLLSEGHSGRYISYRVSKAALNMATAVMAADLSRERIIVVAISPGWVKTDMGGAGARVTPEESVRGMIRLIERITTRDSGRLFNYRGEEIVSS